MDHTFGFARNSLCTTGHSATDMQTIDVDFVLRVQAIVHKLYVSDTSCHWSRGDATDRSGHVLLTVDFWAKEIS